MDKPDPNKMRESKVLSTGFYGYSVLDYNAMSRQVAEQVPSWPPASPAQKSKDTLDT